MYLKLPYTRCSQVIFAQNNLLQNENKKNKHTYKF